jgi:hypothetical protein
VLIWRQSSRHSGEERPEYDVQQLRDLAAGNISAGVMSVSLRRTEDAIRSKAQAEGISLSPPNRSPYGDMTYGDLS